MQRSRVETFYANGGMAKTTVDHILIPTDKVQFISYCAVLRECSSNLSYHRPIFCVLQATLQKQLFRSSGKKLLWKKLEDEQYQKKYQDELAMRLQNSQYKNLKIDSAERLDETVVDVVEQLKSAATTGQFRPQNRNLI